MPSLEHKGNLISERDYVYVGEVGKMTEKSPIVITISRQMGSGGAYIGQQLAKKLRILYLDREIVSQAAKQLSVLEEDLESRDDSERARYHQTLTGKEWTDARQYDLSIDTSKIGVDKSIELILQYLELV